MVLTFTGSISVAEGSAAETRDVLAAAIGCNLAWGIVDAAMYLLSNFSSRARGLAIIKALHHGEPAVAHRLLLDALPPVVSGVLTPTEVEAVRERLTQLPDPSAFVSLNRADFIGAAGVFLAALAMVAVPRRTTPAVAAAQAPVYPATPEPVSVA